MERQRQTLETILGALSPVSASWQDAHSDAVIAAIQSIPTDHTPDRTLLHALLAKDFEAGITTIRLVLDLSRDEFNDLFRKELSGAGAGIKGYRGDPERFVNTLINLGVLNSLHELIATPVSWKTLLVERLKSGRGSAIKGQHRGRHLEDFAEGVVREVFGDSHYKTRCRFTGSKGTSTEKADFAIPSAADPRILVEVKAYGATGSKQTDVLGDVARIVEQKRHDTDLFLITDGTTWASRLNDMRKLLLMQNQGLIARIYTRSDESRFRSDLIDLKAAYRL